MYRTQGAIVVWMFSHHVQALQDLDILLNEYVKQMFFLFRLHNNGNKIAKTGVSNYQLIGKITKKEEDLFLFYNLSESTNPTIQSILATEFDPHPSAYISCILCAYLHPSFGQVLLKVVKPGRRYLSSWR